MDQLFEFNIMFDDRELVEQYANYRVLGDYKQEHNIKK